MPYIEAGQFKKKFDASFAKALGRPPAEDEQKTEELEDDEAKPPVKPSE